jgi:hypothetical protein
MQRRSIGIVAITCGLLANAASAWAAAETWVSGTGSNAGACPITAPCRTFSYAHGQTSAGGTINVLSAGDFGPLTITKSINIVADGVQAGILGGGSIGAAIKIQAGVGDIVSLHGLTIDLRGTDNDGISFLSGRVLHVHDCVIRRAINGIRFSPASETSELYVADSVIADSSTKGAGGIGVAPTGSGAAQVVLDRVRVENSGTIGIFFVMGAYTVGSISAIVRDSVVAGSSKLAAGIGGPGIAAAGYGSGTTKVMVDRSASAHNGSGVRAFEGATIRIGDSTLTGNHTGLSVLSGGVIESYGTNKVSGNVNDGTPTSTITMK